MSTPSGIPGVPDDSAEPLASTAALSDSFAEPGAGTVIGPYRLLQKVGEGGMGEVWAAQQRAPIARRVALKLIKAGMDTREVVARFESERQTLALMNHEAIARVFDAGSTPQGRPFFVMEFVAGLPISTYCDKHKLGVEERLRLFIRVCEGVQHAHQKAIIHRDLKPSNILVSEVDGRPVPKIIDFGVAKAIAQPLTAQTLFTRLGAVVGTVEYMSPEQASSAGEDIDTRTDVYSLGVILYELLVGALPLDFRNLAFDELLRSLREQEPSRPSVRVRTLLHDSAIAARNRQTDLHALRRQLRGDLDFITLKALDKDRSRRYGSPSDLAADLERHLRNDPVIAGPARFGYRAKKYIRRHRLGLGLTASLIALVATFAIVEAFQIRRIARERDRAERTTSFVTHMFAVATPTAARGTNISAGEILGRALKNIDTDYDLKQDPELQAELLSTIGTIYDSLGLTGQARPIFARVLAMRTQLLGPDARATLRATVNVARTLEYPSRRVDAEKLLRNAMDTQSRQFGSSDPDTLRTKTDLASLLFRNGKSVQAEKLVREALSVQSRAHGLDHTDTLRSTVLLAMMTARNREYGEAERLGYKIIGAEKLRFGVDSYNAVAAENSLAFLLAQDSKYSEAEPLLWDEVGKLQRATWADNFEKFLAMDLLLHVLVAEHKYPEAEGFATQTLDAETKALGAKSEMARSALYYRACSEAGLGKSDAALKDLAEYVHSGPVLEPQSQMQHDGNLKSLYTEPRFVALVREAN